MNPDIIVQQHGNLYSFNPRTTRGTKALVASIPYDAVVWGGAAVIDTATADTLLLKLYEQGLDVSLTLTV